MAIIITRSTIVADATVPTTPTITATASSDTAISIALTVASTDNVGVTAYELSWSANGTTGWTVLSSSATFPYSHSGLTSSTAYYYRARAKDAANNYSSYSSNTNATTNSGSSGVFFNPDVESATSILDIFDDRNGFPAATISTDFARPGKTKSVKMVYNSDEAGDDLIIYGTSIGGSFVETSPSLFVRSYERFEGPWEGHWPQGLKTGRYFTRPDNTTSGPLSGNYAYTSEKIIYPGYETSPDPRTYDYVVSGALAYLHSAEINAIYSAGQLFGNGLPYLRTGHWYKLERFYQLNSAMDVPDGIMQWWIDDVLVLNRTDIMFKQTDADGDVDVPNGDTWKSGWFGGNYSNTGTFTPPSTLYRYLTDFYMSTTLDR